MVIKISVRLDEIREMVAKQIGEQIGRKIEPNEIKLEYDGDYDTTDFTGFTVEIKDIKGINVVV